MEEQKAPEKKIVWISCRAKEGCTGTQAEMTLIRRHFGSVEGTFAPDQGGGTTRYRCQTCGGTFTITT